MRTPVRSSRCSSIWCSMHVTPLHRPASRERRIRESWCGLSVSTDVRLSRLRTMASASPSKFRIGCSSLSIRRSLRRKRLDSVCRPCTGSSISVAERFRSPASQVPVPPFVWCSRSRWRDRRHGISSATTTTASAMTGRNRVLEPSDAAMASKAFRARLRARSH